MREDRVVRAIGVHAAQRHRDELRARGVEAFGHRRARAVFARAEEQPGGKFDAGNDEGICFHGLEKKGAAPAQAQA